MNGDCDDSNAMMMGMMIVMEALEKMKDFNWMVIVMVGNDDGNDDCDGGVEKDEGI